ncbi:MAG: NAD(P)H-hydrate epimerase [Pseudomonadota bacterium]
MIEAITAEHMRALENSAIESGAVTGLELMERAGEGVLNALIRIWPDVLGVPRAALILCGPGNNGGDGFVVARLLSARGWTVTVYFYGDVARLPPDARRNYDHWHSDKAGRLRVLTFPTVSEVEAKRFADAVSDLPPESLLVDALFGIGLTRSLSQISPVLKACRDAALKLGLRRVSIDVPSGLSEEGPLGCTGDIFEADLTVTFHRLKRAHERGEAYCGQIEIADIGLDAPAF